MKKFKRILSVILMCALALTFAACEKKASNDEDVTLTWYLAMPDQPDKELVEEELNKITREKIGASVEFVYIETSAFGERMNMNMASGTAFDLYFSGYLSPYANAAENEGILPLDDLLKEHAPKLYEAIPEYAWEVAKYDGKIYAVPNLQGFVGQNSFVTIDEYTKKYNFDISSVKKPEDIEPFLKSIKDNEPSLIPFRYNYGTLSWIDGIYEEITSGIGIRCDGSSPEVVILAETPEYLQGVATLHDWYKKGYIRQDLLSASGDVADYNAGRYPVAGARWLPGSEATNKQSLKRDTSFIKFNQPYMARKNSIAAMTSIGANSKHPEKAIKLLELVNTDPEVINLIALGIEGKHYTLDENNQYTLIEGSGYNTGGAWNFGNQFIAYAPAGSDPAVWAETQKLNEEALKSPLLGFNFDPSKVKNIVSNISAISSEYSGAMQIIDNNAGYEAMKKKKEKAGFNELVEEVQRQINEYWKTKK